MNPLSQVLPPSCHPYIGKNTLDISKLADDDPELLCDTFISLCEDIYQDLNYKTVECTSWIDPIELDDDELTDAMNQPQDPFQLKVEEENKLIREEQFTYTRREHGPLDIKEFIYKDDITPKLKILESYRYYSLLDPCFKRIKGFFNNRTITVGRFVHCYVHFIHRLLEYEADDRYNREFAEVYHRFAMGLKPKCSEVILFYAFAINEIIPQRYPVYVDSLPPDAFLQDAANVSIHFHPTLLQVLLKSPRLRRIYNGEKYDNKQIHKSEAAGVPTLCVIVASSVVARALTAFLTSDSIPYFKNLLEEEVLQIIQHALDYEIYPLVSYCAEQWAEQENIKCLKILSEPGDHIPSPKLADAKNSVISLQFGEKTARNPALLNTLFELFPNVCVIKFGCHRIAVSLLENLSKKITIEVLILEDRDISNKMKYFPSVKLFILKGEREGKPSPPQPVHRDMPILDLRGHPKIWLRPLVRNLDLSMQALDFLITL